MHMVNSIVSKHMARIGSEGGKVSSQVRALSFDDMRKLALRSWSPEARAKRLSNKRAKQYKPPKLNNNKDIA
jgi:hypothetical protein